MFFSRVTSLIASATLGVRHVDDDVDLIDVVPLSREIGADVRLVLVIAADDFDLHAVGCGIEILDRQFRGRDRADAADIGIETRHVGQHADLDRDFALRMRGGCRAGESGECERQCWM